MSAIITPLASLLDVQTALPITMNPAKASTMKDFIMPGVDTMKYLDYFDEYINKHMVDGYGKDVTDDKVQLFSLPTYIQDTSGMFNNVADIYDNALAVLYLTMRGSSLIASRLLSTMVYNMCMEGYNPTQLTPNARLLNYVGLRPRYWQTMGRRALGQAPLYPFSRDNYYDTGNNMYLGIAMCRYVLKFTLDAATHKLLARAIYDIWCFASVVGWCSKGKYHGFIGRPLRPDGEGTYLSIEHNIDAFSMITLFELVLVGTSIDELGTLNIPTTKYNFNDIIPATTTAVATLVDIKTKLAFQKTEIRKLVESLFLTGKGDRMNSYATGTGKCSETNTINSTDPSPTDAVTWNFLSGVDPNADRKNKSLQWSVSDLVKDNIWENRVYTGLIFSSNGTGIQWENTGSGILAYLKFMYLRSTATDAVASNYEVPPDLAKMMKATAAIGRSIVNLLNIQRYGGIPASFEGQGTIDIENSGFNWSYYAYPHTASTMWCAMGLRYLQSEYDETFNPYGVVSGKFVNGVQSPNAAFAWTQNIKYPISCELLKIKNVNIPLDECLQPVPNNMKQSLCGSETITPQCFNSYNLNVFCGLLGDARNPGDPSENVPIHEALTRNPDGVYCNAPGFTICDDIPLMARGATRLYYDTYKDCGGICSKADDQTETWKNGFCNFVTCGIQ